MRFNCSVRYVFFQGWPSFEKISSLSLLEGEGGKEGKRGTGRSAVAKTRFPRKFLSF